MASDVRIIIQLECTECKRRNYTTEKNKRNTPTKLELRRDEIIQSTEAVLLFTFFMMVILWVYDLFFGWFIQGITGFLQ